VQRIVQASARDRCKHGPAIRTRDEEQHVAAFVDSTVKDIVARLRELKDERSRLEAARAALVDDLVSRPTRWPRRQPRRAPPHASHAARARAQPR
jgi:hypothetical protein